MDTVSMLATCDSIMLTENSMGLLLQIKLKPKIYINNTKRQLLRHRIVCLHTESLTVHSFMADLSSHLNFAFG